MQGIAKGILISILVSIGILMFTNLVFFFPWYMTLIMETYNLSQAASNDNYIKRIYYDESVYKLENMPRTTDLSVTVTNKYDKNAVGNNDEHIYESLTEDRDKPYLQRGEKVTITVSAKFLFNVELWGQDYPKEVPVSITLEPIGLKHYKDLPDPNNW